MDQHVRDDLRDLIRCKALLDRTQKAHLEAEEAASEASHAYETAESRARSALWEGKAVLIDGFIVMKHSVGSLEAIEIQKVISLD